MSVPLSKQGKMIRELQKLVQKLPVEYQIKLPRKFLVELASSLLDETVFDIVKNLTDIQQMTEKSLFERRMNLVNSHRASKDKVLQRHRVALDNEYMLNPQNAECLRLKQAMEIKELDQHHEEELTHLDMKVIMELDQSVSDQQITLQKVGVPGFFLSNKPEDVRLQMYLLEFITFLSSKELRT
ncbi:protein DGCR6 [Parasteatoda tepidariorum]|uniref:protein DGCR6 n=1 Tax=Parasteatoda tepidariorum TaxID=114398 RepID=UPI001C71EE97|nr:protein DGCR6 [Parasteatoda tepidariorum]